MFDAKEEGSEPLRDRVAKAIYGSIVLQAREQAEAIDPGTDRIRRVFGTAYRETDRAAAILVFALAEDMMAEGLKRNLNNRIRGGWESATEPTGLLGTAANRIALLHMLNWIRPSTADDLVTLKAIRNRFAHHAELDGFKDQKIRSWIANIMRVEDALDKAPIREELLKRPFTLSEQFLIRSCSVITRLGCDLVIGPISRNHGVDPNDVFGRNYDGMIPPLKELHKVIADVILMIAKQSKEVRE